MGADPSGGAARRHRSASRGARRHRGCARTSGRATRALGRRRPYTGNTAHAARRAAAAEPVGCSCPRSAPRRALAHQTESRQAQRDVEVRRARARELPEGGHREERQVRRVLQVEARHGFGHARVVDGDGPVRIVRLEDLGDALAGHAHEVGSRSSSADVPPWRPTVRRAMSAWRRTASASASSCAAGKDCSTASWVAGGSAGGAFGWRRGPYAPRDLPVYNGAGAPRPA